jgi:hypothetical protein
MKKFILSAAAGLILCTAGFADYKVYDNHQMSKLNPLMAENIEALSDPESDIGGPNGGFNSTGNGKSSSGTEFEVKIIDARGNISVDLFPTREAMNNYLANLSLGVEFRYEARQFMWYQYDCDQTNSKHCVVCFRYRV